MSQGKKSRGKRSRGKKSRGKKSYTLICSNNIPKEVFYKSYPYKKRINSLQIPPPGAHMPKCDDKGNFAKSQSWFSTGQSWCSSINGNKVPGTLTGPTEKPWDCGELST